MTQQYLKVIDIGVTSIHCNKIHFKCFIPPPPHLQTKLPGSMVSAMDVNKANTLLFTADSAGFVYVWNIDGYCVTHLEEEAPECMYH